MDPKIEPTEIADQDRAEYHDQQTPEEPFPFATRLHQFDRAHGNREQRPELGPPLLGIEPTEAVEQKEPTKQENEQAKDRPPSGPRVLVPSAGAVGRGG